MHISWKDRHVCRSHPPSPYYRGPTSLPAQYVGHRKSEDQRPARRAQHTAASTPEGCGSEEDGGAPLSGLGWLLPEQLVSKG